MSVACRSTAPRLRLALPPPPSRIYAYDDGDGLAGLATCCDGRHCTRSWMLPELLGADPVVGALWLHLGPIGRLTTPLVAHDGHDASPIAVSALAMPTWPAHRGFAGWQLDLLAFAERPWRGALSLPPLEALAACGDGDIRMRLLPGGLWAVYGVAWRDADGPWVEMLIRRDDGEDGPTYVLHGIRERHTAADTETCLRARELLLGRVRRGPGNPGLSDSRKREIRAIVRKAEQIHGASPTRGWDAIATDPTIDLPPSTLKRYRRLVQRWRSDLTLPTIPRLVRREETPHGPATPAARHRARR